MQNFYDSLGNFNTVMTIGFIAGFVMVSSMYGLLANPLMSILCGLIFAVIYVCILQLLLYIIPQPFWGAISIILIASILFYLLGNGPRITTMY